MERRARGNLFLLITYGLLGSCGALVFIAVPSSSLIDQGGQLVAYIWGVFCLAGGAAGIVGLIMSWRLFEIVGVVLGATASLTWCVALVLQAVQTASALPLTAACMVAALTAMFAHRWSVAVGRRRHREVAARSGAAESERGADVAGGPGGRVPD